MSLTISSTNSRGGNLEKYRELTSVKHVETHPLFKVVLGGIRGLGENASQKREKTAKGLKIISPTISITVIFQIQSED